MNLEEETLAILRQNHLRANKKLGQNFLINETVIEEILEKAQITSDDVVIEIGPGIGSMTKELINHSKKVIAIELDTHMVEILKKRFSLFENFTLLHGDVLQTDIASLIEGESHVKVVANLPYYITTPIIMKLLEERLPLHSITVMVQKEVGERLCASYRDKEYGAITVSIQYYTTPQILLSVLKENFYPSPEVDSCVIRLDLLSKPRVTVKDEALFFRLVKCAFSQRRKTIHNSLSSFGIPKEVIGTILEQLQIDSRLRAENLSIEQYAQISDACASYLERKEEND